MKRALDLVSLATARLFRAGISYVWPPIFAVVAAASVVWYLRGKDRLPLLASNKIAYQQQLEAVKPVAIGLGALAIVILSAVVWRRVSAKRFDTARVFAIAGSLLIPFGAAPFVLALFQADIEKKTPFLTLFYCALAALFVGWGTYRLSATKAGLDEPEPSSARQALARVAPWAAGVLVLALGAAYAYYFARVSILTHHALATRTIDLGIYDNIFYQSIHGRPLRCTFIKAEYHGSAHFDPILVLLSPLYLLYPRAELILGLQSVWVASGVIPIYLMARRALESRGQALLIGAAYLLHPALHGATLYEFHSLTLAQAPILWTLYCHFTDKKVAYWVALGVALLVREDVPLMLSMVGVLTLIHPGTSTRARGLVTILVCAVYFATVKLVFMTSSGIVMTGQDSYSFAYYYQELIQGGKGIGSLLLSFLTNPAFVVAQMFEEPKVQFLITVFLPLLFVPFFVEKRRILLAYGLALTLLASRTAVFSTHFQYTSTILPFAFAILPEGIRQLSGGALAKLKGLDPARLQRALVVAGFVASAGVSMKFGGIVENKVFRGGFNSIHRKLTPQQAELYAFIEEAASAIPAGKSVGVTNKLGPHVSNRRHVYFYGQRGTDYVFIDEAELKKDRKDKHQAAVREGRLTEVMRRGSYALFQATPDKKPAPPEEAEEDVRDVLGDPQKEE